MYGIVSSCARAKPVKVKKVPKVESTKSSTRETPRKVQQCERVHRLRILSNHAMLEPNPLDEELLATEPARRMHTCCVRPIVFGAATTAASAAAVLLVLVLTSSPAGGQHEPAKVSMSRHEALSTPRREHEVALVNFIRHGERSQDASETGLTPEGKLRAACG